MKRRKALSIISIFFQKCKGDGTKSANKELREYELTPRNSLKHHSCSIAACVDFVR